MPVGACELNGKPGYKWGGSGHCYTYTEGDESSKSNAKSKAEKQGAAAHANGYGMTKATDEYIGEAVKFELKEITSISEDQQRIFGWASVIVTAAGEVVEDSQGHVIDEVELEDAVYEFVRCGGMAGVMHSYMYAGSIIESMVFTKEKCTALGIADGVVPTAWWIGIEIYDAEIWKLVKDGTLPMFSIGGFAILEDVADPPVAAAS